MVIEPPARLDFESAARHATPRVPVLGPRDRVAEVRVALTATRHDCASHIVVCDAGRFTGVIRLEDVLSAPEDLPLSDLLDRDAPVVGPGVDQEIAAWRAVRKGESALSVVDAEGRFVGLAGALLAAHLVEGFESQLQRTVMLAFFLPGIVYLADAVGTQTETVVVRGLSLGVPMRRMVRRELLAGLAIGAVLAAVAGPLIWWGWGDPAIAACVALALFAASSTATVAAMVLPWALDAAGRDPAFGSGPLATVIQDLLSIAIYLAIAVAVLE